jgi:hypothetical protein
MAAPQIFFADLVRERCTGTGAGPLALDGALPGHRAFAGTVPAATLFHYSIAGVHDPAAWEAGTGRMMADGRLERLSIAASSNGGAAVDFAPGLKTVALTVGAGWFAGATMPTAISDVTGLQAALDGKQAAGSYAAESHSHAIAAITGLQTALDGLQPVSTGHGVAATPAPSDTLVIRRASTWLNLPLSTLALKDSSGHVAIGPATAATILHVQRASGGYWTGTAFSTTPQAFITITNSSAGGYDAGVRGQMSDSAGTAQDSFALGTVGTGPWTAGNAASQTCDFYVAVRSAVGSLSERLRLTGSGAVQPGVDNAQSLGSAARRFAVVFAASGTINTSDARDKVATEAVPDIWLDAWGAVGWRRYRFKDGKRWHVGLIAQEVHAAFAGFGVDAFAIGLLCRDPITKESGGGRGRKDRWGLRYDECLAMEAAWQRREIARLSARLSKRRIRQVAA